MATQSWYKWERGAAIPAFAHQQRIAQVLGVELEDIREGLENPADMAPPLPAVNDAPAKDVAGSLRIPVIGLAECGIKGWFLSSALPVTAPLPVEYDKPENLFAVMAIGESLIPEGVRAGYILFCDRSVSPVKNDLVFIHTKEGYASVKRFSSLTEEWLTVQGWLPPDHNGKQTIYTDEIALRTVEYFASVIMIRRKA